MTPSAHSPFRIVSHDVPRFSLFVRSGDMSGTTVRTTWFPLLRVEDLEVTVSTSISARDVRQIIRSDAPAGARLVTRLSTISAGMCASLDGRPITQVEAGGGLGLPGSRVFARASARLARGF